jgi:WD40 repeat protein/serine/threonine protein kinase
MGQSACPSPQELSAFHLGDLTESELERIADHLEECCQCEEISRELDRSADDMVAGLRRYRPSEPLPVRIDPGDTREKEPPSTSTQQPPVEERLPKRVGNYQVLAVLGRGNMGIVYRARHATLGRLVALKMLLDGGFADQERRARFEREAEAVARLQHPHIVQIYEVGEQEERPFLALELVEGVSLEQHLAGKPQSVSEAAHLIETLAWAVHHAHDRGIVHRDLKPSNVLRAADGTPKISDFGLAKYLDAGHGQTQSGAILGTPGYMAPEQAEGRNQDIGPAADVYALGVILYEMLTGRRPFVADSVLALLHQVKTQDPVPPSQLRAGLPTDVETICLKCLQKTPARRYSSAEELAEDLHRFQAGEPIHARPVSIWERGWHWGRRYPGVAGSLVAVALSLVIGTAVAWWFALQANANARRADEKTQEAEANEKRANARAYISDMRLIQSVYEDNLLDQVRELLDGTRPEKTGGMDFRHFEWRYWWRLSHKEQLTLHLPPAARSVVFSPDGSWLAAAGGDEKVRFWDAQSGEPFLTIRHKAGVRGLACSPDGSRLAGACLDGTVAVWDSHGGNELLTLKGHRGTVWNVAWSLDGRRIASASHDKTVRVWDASSGASLFTITAPTEPVYAVAFSPDGKQLAAACDDKTVRVWNAQDGKDHLTLKVHGNIGWGVAFSPDGTQIAAGEQDGTLKIWDAHSGELLHSLQKHRGGIHTVAFSPLGVKHSGALLVASASDDRTVRLWDTDSGETVRIIRGHGSYVWGVAFSPDGKRIATAGDDSTVRVWDARGGPFFPPMAGHHSQVTSIACSADGRLLASGGGTWESRGKRYTNGELKVWEERTARLLFDLKGHASGVTCVAFSPMNPPLLASGSGVWDENKKQYVGGEVKLWDPVGGQEIATLNGHASSVLAVAFSPDGKRLASAGFDSVVKIWDMTQRKEMGNLEAHKDIVTCLAFSPDGQHLASAGFDNLVKVWNVSAGTEVATMSTGYVVASVAYNPDGKTLAAAGYHAEMKVWDTTSGEQVFTLRGHTKGVTSVTFSPDGKRIVAADEDNSVRMWETVSGQEILVLRGHNDIVRSVAFSPDGKRIYSGGWDKMVRIWDATSSEDAPGPSDP